MSLATRPPSSSTHFCDVTTEFPNAAVLYKFLGKCLKHRAVPMRVLRLIASSHVALSKEICSGPLCVQIQL